MSTRPREEPLAPVTGRMAASRRRPPTASPAQPPSPPSRVAADARRHDMTSLRTRRQRARRRSRLARVDLGVGVALALVLLLLGPGLAIAGIVALLALLACAVSLLVGPVRRRRATRRARRR